MLELVLESIFADAVECAVQSASLRWGGRWKAMTLCTDTVVGGEMAHASRLGVKLGVFPRVLARDLGLAMHLRHAVP